MDIYSMESKLKAKSEYSTEDFIKYVLLEMQSPIEDYYLAIDLLKNKYPQLKDIRIAVLGAYLTSTWLSFERNDFLDLLKGHLWEADKQNKAIIYYLLAYDIYMKCDNAYPIEYQEYLKKSILFSERFVYNYVRLSEISCMKEARMLLDKAISNVETVWNEKELKKLSIEDFITYKSFIDEFILGISLSEDMYDSLLEKRKSL